MPTITPKKKLTKGAAVPPLFARHAATATKRVTPQKRQASLLKQAEAADRRARSTRESKLRRASIDELLVYALGGDDMGIVPTLLEAVHDDLDLLASTLTERGILPIEEDELGVRLFVIARKVRAAWIVYERLHEKGAA